jgi:hypothetical protein
MRFTGHVTLTFNNNVSTTAVFLDVEKAFDNYTTPWLVKLSKPQFLINLIKLINSFFQKFKV